MATFKVEVGNGRSGDTLTLEADNADAAVEEAKRQIAESGNPWEVGAVYELALGTPQEGIASLHGRDLPNDGPGVDDDLAVDTVTHAEPDPTPGGDAA